MRAAVRDVLASPWTWVVGAAGFLARGGVLVFLLPIVSLPTPVGVTLLMPPISIDTSGASPALVSELLVVGAVFAVVAAGALVLAALADVVAYQWIASRLPDPTGAGGGDAALRDAASGDAASRAAVVPRRPRTRGLVGRLVAVEVFALLPVIVASVAAARRLVDVGEQEFLLPSSIEVPYAVRVIEGTSVELAAVAVCLVVADAANALASRRLLRRALRMPTVAGGRGATRVIRALAAWLAGWSITAVTVVPGLVVIGSAWPAVRDAYAATLSPAAPSPAALLGATAVFVAAWIAGLLLAGLGSAIRTVVWSVATVT